MYSSILALSVKCGAHFSPSVAELMTVPLEVGHKGELVNAFRGSRGVFLMTPPIAPPETHEMELGKQQADAAVEAGVQHITFSVA